MTDDGKIGVIARTDVPTLWKTLLDRIDRGDRFANLFAARRTDAGSTARVDHAADTPSATAPLTLSVHVATDGGIDTLDAALPPDAGSYPALTARLDPAFWYERVIHDEFGVVPVGHPRLAPLVLHGSPTDHRLSRHVAGYGMFTIPHGPVRSGVFESIEYLVETPGEEIPHLDMRVFYKRRGIEQRFRGMTPAGGVLLAERTEGIASVAHALAFCHAVERAAGCEPPRAAKLVRVLHAELERLANHLDVAAKLADAGGLVVGAARFAVYKERVMRLTSSLCGSRFGRRVVVPGGVVALPRRRPADIRTELAKLEKSVTSEVRALMVTSSFLDRLRGTGPLPSEKAGDHGALGPIGRASGIVDDARRGRPYDAYVTLGMLPLRPRDEGDSLARLEVRWDEVAGSFHLIRQALDELVELADGGHLTDAGQPSAVTAGASWETDPVQPPAAARSLRERCEIADGRAVGWAEAPQGEVLYDVTLAGGLVEHCQPRSASFHNLVLFHDVFAGDILTDFPFIEASFGLSVAGVAL